MREEKIIEILLDWNFWKKGIESGIERKIYLSKLVEMLETNFIISLIGIRRAGKSTLIFQAAKKLMEKGVPKENILIINLEDKRIEKLDINFLDKVFEVYSREIKPKDKPYIFLDEVHRVYEWEKWVRSLHELKKARILVSGSSSQLMRKELATLLTGRHLNIEVFPLSFEEFLNFKKIEIKNKLDLIYRKIEVQSLLKEYLEFGGFPEVVLTERFKQEILREYFSDIIMKDLVERYKIRKIEEIKQLTRFLLTNISSNITFRSLSKFLELSVETVKNFCALLKEVYLIFFVKMYDPSIKKQEKLPKKIYSIDTGLANAVGFRFSENIGKLMENLVFTNLLHNSKLSFPFEIYYWKEYGKREGKEVDFVIKEGLNVRQLIQVTYASSKDEIEKREIMALNKASELLKCKNLLIITWDYEDEEKIKGRKIKFLPLWRWLLEK